MPEPVIIFDFGGVLLDWDPRYLYRRIFGADEAAMENFLAEVDFYGWNTRQDAGRSFAEGVSSGCKQFPQYCDLLRIYHERWAESIAGPIQGTVAILKALKENGYRLFGLSNWSAETFYLVRSKYEFLGWFEEIVLSGEVGLIKPDPRIFELLLEKVNAPASACLLIDDSLNNLESAERLGFLVVHFQSPGQLGQVLTASGIVLSPESATAMDI
jgi:2-haloacid dehalogenase